MTLTLENLGLCVQRNWIIRNINIEVQPGECLALLGPSGCGKSTTLRLIAGLDKPSEGSISLFNKDLKGISPVNRKIGMVFQSYALFPHLTVVENLALGLKVRGYSIAEQKRRISYVLELLQIATLRNRKPQEISGGQRQRIALARALLRDPLIYLLDEPMSNLDAQLREDLRPELRKLIISGDKPVIYVTHDQQEAMAISNRIAVLNNGNLEQIGTPQELYLKPQSIFVANFIGRPQINMFEPLDSIRIAVRPEDIYLDPDGIQCKLIYKEWLGQNQLLFFDTPKGTIRMIGDTALDIPSEPRITWKKQKEHHFSTKSGKRIS